MQTRALLLVAAVAAAATACARPTPTPATTPTPDPLSAAGIAVGLMSAAIEPKATTIADVLAYSRPYPKAIENGLVGAWLGVLSGGREHLFVYLYGDAAEADSAYAAWKTGMLDGTQVQVLEQSGEWGGPGSAVKDGRTALIVYSYDSQVTGWISVNGRYTVIVRGADYKLGDKVMLEVRDRLP